MHEVWVSSSWGSQGPAYAERLLIHLWIVWWCLELCPSWLSGRMLRDVELRHLMWGREGVREGEDRREGEREKLQIYTLILYVHCTCIPYVLTVWHKCELYPMTHCILDRWSTSYWATCHILYLIFKCVCIRTCGVYKWVALGNCSVRYIQCTCVYKLSFYM